MALDGGCRLLSLPATPPRGHLDVVQEAVLAHLERHRIPAGTYPGVTDARTLRSKTILVASDELPAHDAEAILQAIFDSRDQRIGQERLLEHHEAAEEIRLLTTLREWQKPRRQREVKIPFHAGAARFWQRAQNDLLIAAGPLGGTSFRLGTEMAEVLTNRLGISTRVINTDGSRESIALLRNEPDSQERKPGTETDGWESKTSGRPAGPEAGDEELQKLRNDPVKLAIVHNDDAAQAYAAGRRRGKRLTLLTFLYPEAVHLVVPDPPRAGRDQKFCLPPGGTPPASLREWLRWLHTLRSGPNPPQWKFGIASDLWWNRTWTEELPPSRQLPGFYSHLEGLEGADDVAYVELSPVQIQHRLLSGEITAALVNSGVPMEAVDQMVDANRYPRLKRAIQDARPTTCPPLPGQHMPPTRIRVLSLDTPQAEPNIADETKRDAPGRAEGRRSGMLVAPFPQPSGSNPPVPDSIQGLVASHRFLKPLTIPPSTYRRAQKERALTVAVEAVLIGREDCANVFDIVRALVEDEVRLSSVVKGINLHTPVLKGEASIPLHSEARRYYEEQGIIARIPPRPGVFWQNIVPGLIGLLLGVVGSVLTTIFVPQVRGWVAGRLRPERRKSEFEQRPRNTYFNRKDAREQLTGLRIIWLDVAAAYENRELKPQHADGLNKLIRDYEDQLRKDLAYEGNGRN
jgi:TRAP-type uncharacterized transport system substrate-binding protein